MNPTKPLGSPLSNDVEVPQNRADFLEVLDAIDKVHGGLGTQIHVRVPKGAAFAASLLAGNHSARYALAQSTDLVLVDLSPLDPHQALLLLRAIGEIVFESLIADASHELANALRDFTEIAIQGWGGTPSPSTLFSSAYCHYIAWKQEKTSGVFKVVGDYSLQYAATDPDFYYWEKGLLPVLTQVERALEAKKLLTWLAPHS